MAHAAPIMIVEKRPPYALPRAMNANTIPENKNAIRGSGNREMRGTPASAAIDTIALNTGTEYHDRCGGSFTDNTIQTLSIKRPSVWDAGSPDCQIDNIANWLPYVNENEWL